MKLAVKPEDRNTFVEISNRTAEATLKNEKGEVLLYKLNQSPFDKNIFYQVEEWSSLKALAHHVTTEHFKKYIRVAGPLLIESRVCFYELDVDNEAGDTPASLMLGLDHHLNGSHEPMWNFKDLQALEKSIAAAVEKPPFWMPNIQTKAIGITWKFAVKPEDRTAFVEIVKGLAEATLRKEKGGALLYKLHQSPFDRNIFYQTEEWSSVQACAHHFTTDHFKNAVSAGGPFLLESCACLYELGAEIES